MIKNMRLHIKGCYLLLVLFSTTTVYAQQKLIPIPDRKAKRTKWEHTCNSAIQYCNCEIPLEDVPDSAMFIVNIKKTRSGGTHTDWDSGITTAGARIFSCKPSRFFFAKNKEKQYKLSGLKTLFNSPRYDAANFWYSAYMSNPFSEVRIAYLQWAVEMYNRQHGFDLQSYTGLTSKRNTYTGELERIKEETIRRLPTAIRERLNANPKLLER
jgi:hypothetical protein